MFTEEEAQKLEALNNFFAEAETIYNSFSLEA